MTYEQITAEKRKLDDVLKKYTHPDQLYAQTLAEEVPKAVQTKSPFCFVYVELDTNYEKEFRETKLSMNTYFHNNNGRKLPDYIGNVIKPVNGVGILGLGILIHADREKVYSLLMDFEQTSPIKFKKLDIREFAGQKKTLEDTVLSAA